MNKEELVQEISKKAKVTQKEAGEVLSALIDTIQKTVAYGKKVTLVGFGTFEPRKRAARNGRNPQTNKEIKILTGDINLPKITVKLTELKFKPLSFGHQDQESFYHIKARFPGEKKIKI